MSRTHIVVVGGGITGLAAAWELSADPGLDIDLYEASDRFGGKIHTSAFAGLAVDEGADAFLCRVPDAVELCDEVGIDAAHRTSPGRASAFVWVDGSLRRLPQGLVLGFPASFEALASSGILTPDGLRRARCEVELDGQPLVGDTPIGSFVAERYGPEVVDRLVGPLIGGINAGDVNEMSLDAVLPQIADVAHRSASISKGLTALAPAESGPIFSAPVGGMGRLIAALVESLDRRGVGLHTGSTLAELPSADGVVLTTPADVTARLVEPRCPAAAQLLGGIRFASIAFVTLAYDPDDVGIELDGSGFLIPRDAGLTATAVSWASSKWAHLRIDDAVIMRVSVGHIHDTESIGLDDGEIIRRIGEDLRTTMAIDAAPIEYRITRYPNGFPQYDVGHLGRIDAVDAALRSLAPDLAVCGMAHRGVGIPACIKGGRTAARALAERLRP